MAEILKIIEESDQIQIFCLEEVTELSDKLLC